MLSSIIYPKEFNDESQRNGVKFNYYKIEPVNLNKPEEEPKEDIPMINLGSSSGRISVLQNWQINPQQGNINYLKESVMEETLYDFFESYLEDLNVTKNSNDI